MAHTSLKQLFMGSICHWLSAHKRVGGGAGVKKNCVQLRSATGAFFGPAATLLCSLFAGSLSLTLLLRPEGSVAELIAGKILLLFPLSLSTFIYPIQVDLTKRYGNLRNGVNDIKNHKWFATTEWIAVYQRKVRGPFCMSSSSRPVNAPPVSFSV